ncbi:DUF5069 domain-containing protein [Akkermansiaceae bacterium]|nr:DUF5069 domain-containing protein [Akkermansiaceae bacterium]
MTWNEQFEALFDACLSKYQSGDQNFETYYSDKDHEFLKQIGYKPRELFDFIEDFADEGVPAKSTALLIAAVRRDYFRVVQEENHSDKEVTRDDIPSFGQELDEIAYLPRIIAKARAKLKGELDPDVMFSCGGDRKFLRENKLHPADFLRNVWAADSDDQKIADYVKSSTA